MVDDSYPSTSTQMTPAERLRLVRSLRKIGALLGETPVLDDTDSAKPELRMPSLGKQGPFALRLVIRPPQLPGDTTKDIDIPTLSRVAGAENAISFTPLPAVQPLSPLFSPLSPTTPTAWTEHDATIARGHRMAKLTRTLGERVPTTLIRASPTPTAAPTLIKRRKRASTILVSSTAPPPAPLQLMLDDLASTRSSDDAKSPIGDMHVHPALLSPTSPFLSPGMRASIADWLFPLETKADVVEDEADYDDTPPPLPHKYDELPALPVVVDAELPSPPLQDAASSSTTIDVDAASHRREDSWVGEWVTYGDVQEDETTRMSQVRDRLRRLRRSRSLTSIHWG